MNFEALIFGTAATAGVGHASDRILKRHGLLVFTVIVGGAYLLYHVYGKPHPPAAGELLQI